MKDIKEQFRNLKKELEEDPEFKEYIDNAARELLPQSAQKSGNGLIDFYNAVKSDGGVENGIVNKFFKGVERAKDDFFLHDDLKDAVPKQFKEFKDDITPKNTKEHFNFIKEQYANNSKFKKDINEALSEVLPEKYNVSGNGLKDFIAFNKENNGFANSFLKGVEKLREGESIPFEEFSKGVRLLDKFKADAQSPSKNNPRIKKLDNGDFSDYSKISQAYEEKLNNSADEFRAVFTRMGVKNPYETKNGFDLNQFELDVRGVIGSNSNRGVDIDRVIGTSKDNKLSQMGEDGKVIANSAVKVLNRINSEMNIVTPYPENNGGKNNGLSPSTAPENKNKSSHQVRNTI